jgi:POT family proton-dependent oligopeptide transporter
VSLATLGGLGWYIFARCDRIQRDRMLALVALIISTVFFWALFEQAAGSMTLFADRNTDKSLFGVTLTASQFGAANSFFIFTLAPLFAFLWTWLGRRNIEPGTPVKFALGIIQAGLGFGALAYGAQFPNEAGIVSAWWLILAYLLHTTGELCLSPVGLSAVTKLSVPGVVGVMMGAWFLASAYSGYVAALLGTMVSESDGFVTLFDQLLWAGVIAGVVLLIATPFLKRLMHGIR